MFIVGASQQEGASTSNGENESNARYRFMIFYIVIQAIAFGGGVGINFADIGNDWYIWLIIAQIAIGVWPLLKSAFISFLR